MSLVETSAQIIGTSPWSQEKSSTGQVEDAPNLKNINLEAIILSDSIIFLTTTNHNAVLINLFATVRNLMAKCIYFGFPLRGAISHGVITFDGGPIIAGATLLHYQLFGKPIVEAAKLEKIQNWSGCIVDESVNKRFLLGDLILFDKYIIPYPVQIKRSTSKGINYTEEMFYVINWPYGITDGSKERVNEDKIRYAFGDHKKSIEGLEDMIINTIKFFNFINSPHLLGVS